MIKCKRCGLVFKKSKTSKTPFYCSQKCFEGR